MRAAPSIFNIVIIIIIGVDLMSRNEIVLPLMEMVCSRACGTARRGGGAWENMPGSITRYSVG
jgi:hypothetical protein